MTFPIPDEEDDYRATVEQIAANVRVIKDKLTELIDLINETRQLFDVDWPSDFTGK